MRRRRCVRFKNSNLAALVFSSPCSPPSPMDHEAVFCGTTSFSDPADANNARRGRRGRVRTRAAPPPAFKINFERPWPARRGRLQRDGSGRSINSNGGSRLRHANARALQARILRGCPTSASSSGSTPTRGQRRTISRATQGCLLTWPSLR